MVLDLVAVLAFGVGRPSDRSPAVAPAPLAAGSTLDKPLDPLPLLDEHGRRTSLAAFRGRYLVLAPTLTLCHDA